MSNYYLTDLPRAVPDSLYRDSLAKAVELLAERPEVLAVYQVGGISAPGISDLDLVVVFRHQKHSAFNLHEQLTADEKYLFIHRLYGVGENDFHAATGISFFHNYKLLFGNVQDTGENNLFEEEKNQLRRQIALEYMLKMYINAVLQQKYRILKVRSILLHVKAMAFDLEYLGLEDSDLSRMVRQLITWRKEWFSDRVDTSVFIEWWETFVPELEHTLNTITEGNGIFIPGTANLQMARNIVLQSSDAFRYKVGGFPLPAFPVRFFGKKYFNLQNRFRKFRICVRPLPSENVPEVLIHRSKIIEALRVYQEQYLPWCYTLSSSLHL